MRTCVGASGLEIMAFCAVARVVLTNVIVGVISLALLWHHSIAVGGIDKFSGLGKFYN